MLPNFQFSIFNFQSKLNFLKLSIILILFSTLYFTFSPIPSFAKEATPAATVNSVTPTTNPEVPNNLHNWTQNVMIEVASSLVCQLVGVDPLNTKQSCLGVDPNTGAVGFSSPQKIGTGGAIGVMGQMLSVLYTPPAHGLDYFQNLAQGFIFTKGAYAQTTGAGFEGLIPLLDLWTVFRNFVYLVFVIVFIAIGLAIMLRIKIDPRTVMTIQNQIPKIIIGILLVTFSFAIAGFLIDLMYVSMHLIYNIVSQAPGIGNVSELNPLKLQGKSAISAIGGSGEFVGITHHISFSIKNVIYDLLGFNNQASFMSIFTDVLSAAVGVFMGIQAAQAVSGLNAFGIPVGGFVAPTAGTIAGSGAAVGTKVGLVYLLPYLIAFLVVFLAMLIALFKLWFALIVAYVQILLAVVLAPFWIMGSLLPGSPVNVGGWFRNIIANLAAFPATIGLFLLGKAFMRGFGVGDSQGQFIPPLIGNPGDTKAIGAIIGLGIILMAPNIVNMLKTALKAPKLETGAGIRTLGAGIGAPMGILNRGGSIGSTLFGLSNIPGVKNLPVINKISGGRAPGGGGHP